MVLPNFLIIGAQKSGTTWLYEKLKQHPSVFLPEQKELEFFSHSGKQKQIGLKGYSKMFDGYSNEKAIGEATPSYFWNSENYIKWNKKPTRFEKNIPLQVKKALGEEVKLIISLRNPVDRAVSAYFHHIAWKEFTYDSHLLDVGDRLGIVHMGFYYEHIKKWLEYFDLRNFYISIYEKDIVKNSKANIKSLYNFLSVDDTFTPNNMEKKVHKGLDRFEYNGNYYISTIKENIDLVDPNDPQFQKNFKLVISSETIKKLKQIYREDIKKLSKLLNIDLISIWA